MRTADTRTNSNSSPSNVTPIRKRYDATNSLQPPLSLRRPGALQVLGIARISTVNQNVKSLADQEALIRRWVEENYSGVYELRMIAGQGSGERLDRKEVFEANEAIESNQFDVVVMEDLGRAFRRVHAIIFCELCEDHGTRLIAINDSIDTCQSNWRLISGIASMRHEMYNADTAARIRRSMRNRFVLGGVIRRLIYGYVKSPGANTDNDVHVDPEARAVYDEIFHRLENGANYCEIADLLNNRKISPGPSSKTGRWTPGYVKGLVHNQLLKGIRLYNVLISHRVNKLGHHVQKKAPASELLTRFCPHLQIIETERYDRVLNLLKKRNSHFSRTRIWPDGKNPREGMPRKKTIWPSQHLCCGVCGRIMILESTKRNGTLICSGASEYRCWNATTCNVRVAGVNLANAVLAAAELLPEYDQELMSRLTTSAMASRSEKTEQLSTLGRKRQETLNALEKLTSVLEASGGSETVIRRIRELEEAKQEVEIEIRRVESVPDEIPDLPPISEIRKLAKAAVASFDFKNPDFGRVMSTLCPKFYVLPFLPFDGGAYVLRAFGEVRLAALFSKSHPAVGDLFRKTARVDLFDPATRFRLCSDVLPLILKGMTQKDVAKKFGLSVCTIQSVIWSQRKMEKLGIVDPYQLVIEPPPTKGTRYRRRDHARYRFDPLSGFPRFQIAKTA